MGSVSIGHASSCDPSDTGTFESGIEIVVCVGQNVTCAAFNAMLHFWKRYKSWSRRRKRGGLKKMSSHPVSAKRHFVIWDNTTHVEVSATHNKRTVLNISALNGSIWPWTHLKYSNIWNLHIESTHNMLGGLGFFSLCVSSSSLLSVLFVNINQRFWNRRQLPLSAPLFFPTLIFPPSIPQLPFTFTPPLLLFLLQPPSVSLFFFFSISI